MPLKDSIIRMREAMVNMRRNPLHTPFVIDAFASVLEDLATAITSAQECSDPDESINTLEPQLADGTGSQDIIDSIRREQTEAAAKEVVAKQEPKEKPHKVAKG